MIDSEGFRFNVAMVIMNRDDKVLWCRRAGQQSWQFPQGGVMEGESPTEALYRELWEEVGLKKQDVEILDETQEWLRYRLPKRYIRQNSEPLCIGQQQKWFLLRLLCDDDSALSFNTTEQPEFDGFRWANFWEPVDEIIAFKRKVYRTALKQFSAWVSDK